METPPPNKKIPCWVCAGSGFEKEKFCWYCQGTGRQLLLELIENTPRPETPKDE